MTSEAKSKAEAADFSHRVVVPGYNWLGTERAVTAKGGTKGEQMNKFIALLIIVCLTSGAAYCQEIADPAQQDYVNSQSGAAEDGILDEAADVLEDQFIVLWQALLAGLVAVIISSLAAFYGGLKSGIEKGIRQGLERLFWSVSPSPGRRKNLVIFVGLGRSGKTSLINWVKKPFGQHDTEVTDGFDIHHAEKKLNGQIYDFYLTDYSGQDFISLMRGFIAHQFLPESPLKHGAVNSLIIVVDLFSDEMIDGKVPHHEEISGDRIGYHLAEWSDTALDAVFALLTDKNLKYVCLFINKLDMWTGSGQSDATDVAKDCFAPLIDRIRPRTRGIAEFDVVVGSAYTGTNIGRHDSIIPALYRYSIPMDEEIQEVE